MPAKTWNEMTDAEKAEINAQEDARESYKNSMSGWKPSDDFQEPSDDDLADYFLRMEEAQYGHRDRFYW